MEVKEYFEILMLIERIREFVISAASGIYTEEEVQMIQKEINILITKIEDKISCLNSAGQNRMDVAINYLGEIQIDNKLYNIKHIDIVRQSRVALYIIEKAETYMRTILKQDKDIYFTMPEICRFHSSINCKKARIIVKSMECCGQCPAQLDFMSTVI